MSNSLHYTLVKPGNTKEDLLAASVALWEALHGGPCSDEVLERFRKAADTHFPVTGSTEETSLAAPAESPADSAVEMTHERQTNDNES